MSNSVMTGADIFDIGFDAKIKKKKNLDESSPNQVGDDDILPESITVQIWPLPPKHVQYSLRGIP